MVKSAIINVVDFCTRYAWLIIAVTVVLSAGSAVYSARNFAIKTDVNDLISPDLPWAKRASQYMHHFPQRGILVVVDASTPENAERATDRLAAALRAHPERFRSVSQPGSGGFFEQNGLLFLPTKQVEQLTTGLTRGDALLGSLASDPSLRGILDALSLTLIGVQRGDLKLDDMTRILDMASDTLSDVLAAKPASFSWQLLASGQPPQPRDLRRFLQVEPVLDFSALEPGRVATDAIAKIASDLNLAGEFQARVRQTGRIPIDDDEFATIRENAGFNTMLMIGAVLVILWLALHSFRIIFAVVVSLVVGLAVSTATGLLMVGALNVISVAFFVLFIGLGVDFGIQFSVRYRAERHDYPDLRTALRSAAMKAGGPLALAAIATAVGFASFLPTDYKGVSELGQIAGAGMLIAFFASITLLPALLTALNPPGEVHAVGFSWLAPVDRFLERHRIPVVVTTILVVLVASPLLYYLPFDFNPLHLQNPEVEFGEGLPGTEAGPADRSQCRRDREAEPSGSECRRTTAGRAPPSVADDDAERFRSARPGREAQADPGRCQKDPRLA